MDSRAYKTNTPGAVRIMSRFVMQPLLPLVKRFVDKQFRPVADAAVDVIDLGVGRAHAGERGYFTLLDKDEPDSVALDDAIQEKIWKISAEWAGITEGNTALKGAF